VAPEILVVPRTVTPVMFVAFNELPVIEAPEILFVKVPLMPVYVAPVIVPETNKPDPEMKTPDNTVKLPLIVWSPAKVWLMAVKNWKTPLVKLAFPPVTV